MLHQAQQSIVQLVAEQLKSVFEVLTHFSVSIVREMCSLLGVNVRSAEVTSACAKLEKANSVMYNLDNVYKRD